MSYPEVWLNYDNRLFYINDGKPQYLNTVDVLRVMWQRQNDERVILYGYMPENMSLLDLPDGCVFELVHARCSDPAAYEDNKVIMRFSDCHTRRKWIARPTAPSQDYADAVRCHVELACKIEVLAGEQ